MAALFVSTRHLSVVLEAVAAVVDLVVAVEVVAVVMVRILSLFSIRSLPLPVLSSSCLSWS